MSGVFLRNGDDLVAMIETPYEAESVLQELLARDIGVLFLFLVAHEIDRGPESLAALGAAQAAREPAR